MDQILPDPKDSIMWSADFMGSIGSGIAGYVRDGPFSSWRTLTLIDKLTMTDQQVVDAQEQNKQLPTLVILFS